MKDPLPRPISRPSESVRIESATSNLLEWWITLPNARISPWETGRRKYILNVTVSTKKPVIKELHAKKAASSIALK
jgi:hypothetical protein